MAQIVPVILCGGSGTRLWPASRQNDPKQFHNMGGRRTLVQETAHRALAASGAVNLLSVTQDRLRETLATQIDALALPARHHILLEPSARNTAAAIAFAALYVEQHLGGGIMWVLPSDHVIKNEAALSQALKTAVATAQTGRLVTFGIHPDRPEPGLGYIRAGAPLSQNTGAHVVEEFVEKPSMEVAVQYVASGKYLWNSGMFVMDAATFLAALRRHAPQIDSATRHAFATAALDGDICSLQAEAYGAIPSAPVDKAVMEKDRGIAVVPCDLGWSDVGSWQSLWEISPKQTAGNVSIGDVVQSGTSNSYLHAHSRLVAVAGIDNVAVIETADAVLVAGLDAHQSIRDLVAILQQQDRAETKAHRQGHFGWGSRERLRAEPGYTLDELILKAAASFPAPASWWPGPTQLTIVSGRASIQIDDETHDLAAGEALTLQPGPAVTITAGPQSVTLLALTIEP